MNRTSRHFSLAAFAVLVAVSCVPGQAESPDDDAKPGLFAVENLVAWCIVPFDAKQRTPAERAEMVGRLGLKRIAYDWRQEHVPQFEREILEYKKRDIEFFAFWSWHPSMAALIEKHDIHPQIWRTNPSPAAKSQEARVAAAVKDLLPLVMQAEKLACPVGLYNHGGWGGRPENLVAVCRRLREQAKTDRVGIVYNFHHAHDRIDRFAGDLQQMLPYLLCVNINGMNDEAKPKIVTLGEGRHERAMIKALADSGYAGPIGILDHRGELDAEESLRLNLRGLDRIQSRK